MTAPAPHAAARRRDPRPLLIAALAVFAIGCDDAATQRPPRGAPGTSQPAATPTVSLDAPGTADATALPSPDAPAEPRWRHPLGIAFDPPQGWQVGEALGAIQLTPPDPATHAG